MAEPPVTVRAFHVTAGTNLPVTRIVVHATCPPKMPGTTSSSAGQAHATAEYFTSAGAGGSAHYVVDVAGEEHCLEENRIAWHAPPNEHSVGIEICGQSTYTRAEWLSDAVWPAVARAASRVADLCARYNIPAVRLIAADLLAGRHGICGHNDVTQAWHQSDHTDPGPDFPWDRFITAVTGAPPSAPFPQGDDLPAPTDVVDTFLLPTGEGWDLHADGGVFATEHAPSGVPRDYWATANDGTKYHFDQATQDSRNAQGMKRISYPALNAQGSRYFVRMIVITP